MKKTRPQASFEKDNKNKKEALASGFEVSKKVEINSVKNILKDKKAFSVKAPKKGVTRLGRKKRFWPRAKESFLSVNLIPKDLLEISVSEKRRIIRYLFLAVLISLFLVFSAYLVLDYFEKKANRRLNSISFSLNEARSKIELYKDLETASRGLQDKMTLAKYILDNHIYWTNAFKFLEKHTIPTVYYQNLNSNVVNGFSVTAVAVDFESVARQLLALQKSPTVSNVTITSITLEELDDSDLLSEDFPKTVVKFEMTVVLDPNVYLFDGLEGIVGN